MYTAELKEKKNITVENESLTEKVTHTRLT